MFKFSGTETRCITGQQLHLITVSVFDLTGKKFLLWSCGLFCFVFPVFNPNSFDTVKTLVWLGNPLQRKMPYGLATGELGSRKNFKSTLVEIEYQRSPCAVLILTYPGDSFVTLEHFYSALKFFHFFPFTCMRAFCTPVCRCFSALLFLISVLLVTLELILII